MEAEWFDAWEVEKFLEKPRAYGYFRPVSSQRYELGRFKDLDTFCNFADDDTF